MAETGTVSQPEVSNASTPAAGGSGLLGGIFGLISTLIAAKQNQYATQEAQAQQKWYYEDTKNWNSPVNQRNLRALAGLNPYSDGNAAAPGTVAQPVNMADNIPSLANTLSNSFNQMANRSVALLAQRIQKKSLELQEKKLNIEEKLTDATIDEINARIPLHEANVFGKSLDNVLNDMLRPYIVGQAQEQYRGSTIQNAINQFVSSTQNSRYEKEMEKLTSDIHFQKAMEAINQGKLGVAKDQMKLASDKWDLEKIPYEKLKNQKELIDTVVDDLFSHNPDDPSTPTAKKFFTVLFTMAASLFNK